MTVPLPEKRFLDFTRRVSRHLLKNDFPGPFISGKFPAEIHDFLLRTENPLLKLNDSRRDLSEPCVRQTDDSHILDLVVSAQEILYLYRIQILAAG